MTTEIKPKSIELAPWTKWLGTPNYTSGGIPIYTPAEIYFDTSVHVVSLLWVAQASWYLFTLHPNSPIPPNIIIYIITMIWMFCTSFAYNVIGCGWHYKAELLRHIDHAAIYLYIAGCYTALLGLNSPILYIIWPLCLLAGFLKIRYERQYEIPCMILLLVLGLFPLYALRNNPPVCKQLGLIIGCYAIGATFYLNNYIQGAMAFWHIFVLTGTVLFWKLVYNQHSESPNSLCKIE